MRQAALRSVCSTRRSVAAIDPTEAREQFVPRPCIGRASASARDTPADTISLAPLTDNRLIEKALRTTLLSAEGAALAAGPLDGLTKMFVQARLFLNR
jgi:hypothetical protein